MNGECPGERKGEKINGESRKKETMNGECPGAYKKWFPFIDAVMLSRKRALVPVEKLKNCLIVNGELYGFIVFEVAWTDVRGISYINELQTDTSLAIETKLMIRWEFESIGQAARTISSWFSGSVHDHILLRDHFQTTIGDDFHDTEESFDEKTSIQSPNKRRRIIKRSATSIASADLQKSHAEESPEPTLYRNVLILFRFNDPHLPFKLRDTIMPRLRLLTLLEAGLPSWAIFLQSYPGFSRLYRPWMCPLARALYVVISFVTVLIGFYDLYKNVPLLKTTASHLFGPWVEEWEMVSRIKYLGTMLFLHNFQKGAKGFLRLVQGIVSFVSFAVVPVARPFEEYLVPVLSVVGDVGEYFFALIWMVVESSVTRVGDVVEVLVLPIWYMLSICWNIASSIIYPTVWVLLYVPFRVVHGFCSVTYNMVGGMWLTTRGLFHFTRGVESTVSITTYDVSIWRSLWNDLFSKVFRALRSILHGFVAFFTACNRHRLSIYNHVKEFIHRLLHAAKRASTKQTGLASADLSVSQTSNIIIS